MNIDEMKLAAAMGLTLEFVDGGLIGPGRTLTLNDYAVAIRALAPSVASRRAIWGGQGMPCTHGWVSFVQVLRAQASANNKSVGCPK